MLANSSPSGRLIRSKGVLISGVLGTVATLLLTGAGLAAAAPPAADKQVQPGQAWMGAGTRLEQGPSPSPVPI